MKRFLKMYQVEQKIFFRSPDVILFSLAMPLVTLILITIIAGNTVLIWPFTPTGGAYALQS